LERRQKVFFISDWILDIEQDEEKSVQNKELRRILLKNLQILENSSRNEQDFSGKQ
jgi:hypothetical protein